MEKIELEAKERIEVRKDLKKLRQAGFVPAVVYGKKITSFPVSIDNKTFVKTILKSEAGMNAIVTLKIGGKSLAVLTQAVQIDPLTDELLHVDFRNIAMDEAIRTKVHVELTGIPIGVKEGGGILVHGLREVEVECLPTSIPDKFIIDVTPLNINESFHVSDLAKDAKVKILSEPQEMIATCAPPTKEEVVEAPIPTPSEVPSDVAADAVADEKVKEKSAPGAIPAAVKPEKK
ncbi:MAG: 50S ribosomal protein L25 [bacterium]